MNEKKVISSTAVGLGAQVKDLNNQVNELVDTNFDLDNYNNYEVHLNLGVGVEPLRIPLINYLAMNATSKNETNFNRWCKVQLLYGIFWNPELVNSVAAVPANFRTK